MKHDFFSKKIVFFYWLSSIDSACCAFENLIEIYSVSYSSFFCEKEFYRGLVLKYQSLDFDTFFYDYNRKIHSI